MTIQILVQFLDNIFFNFNFKMVFHFLNLKQIYKLFKINIVDDELIYKDEKNKKLGYVIKEGSNTYKSNTMKFVTPRKKKLLFRDYVKS